MPIILSSAVSGHAQFLFEDRPAWSFCRSDVCLATPPNSSVLACAAEKSLGFCLESSGRNMDSAKRAPGRPPVSELWQGRGSCHGNCGRYVNSAKRPPVSELQQTLVVWVRSYDSGHGDQGGGDGHCQRDPRQRPPRLHARVSAQPGRAVSRPSIHHHRALTTTAYPPAPRMRSLANAERDLCLGLPVYPPMREALLSAPLTASAATTTKVLAVLRPEERGGKRTRDPAHADLGCFSPSSAVSGIS
ncbi:uncharacterized protein LOC144121315 [Amblyomma americanum]